MSQKQSNVAQYDVRMPHCKYWMSDRPCLSHSWFVKLPCVGQMRPVRIPLGARGGGRVGLHNDWCINKDEL